MNKLYLTLAFLTTLTVGQPVYAEGAVGQMIDDSGLVISSFEDGTVSEFYLSKEKPVSKKVTEDKGVSKKPAQENRYLEILSKH
jgi:hypothetical protein